MYPSYVEFANKTANIKCKILISLQSRCKDDQQSQWEMLNLTPKPPMNPLSDRHQIWRE